VGGWSGHIPAALPPGKISCTHAAGWAPGTVWTGVESRKYLVHTGFEPRTFQLAASYGLVSSHFSRHGSELKTARSRSFYRRRSSLIWSSYLSSCMEYKGRLQKKTVILIATALRASELPQTVRTAVCVQSLAIRGYRKAQQSICRQLIYRAGNWQHHTQSSNRLQSTGIYKYHLLQY